MASLHTFTFDNLSRIGDDVCALSERDTQNNDFGTYTTKNYFEKFCGMAQPINFATKQPNVFYNGGPGVVGAGGDCSLLHVIAIRRTTMLKNTSRQLQVRVLDVPPLGFCS